MVTDDETCAECQQTLEADATSKKTDSFSHKIFN